MGNHVPEEVRELRSRDLCCPSWIKRVYVFSFSSYVFSFLFFLALTSHVLYVLRFGVWEKCRGADQECIVHGMRRWQSSRRKCRMQFSWRRARVWHWLSRRSNKVRPPNFPTSPHPSSRFSPGLTPLSTVPRSPSKASLPTAHRAKRGSSLPRFRPLRRVWIAVWAISHRCVVNHYATNASRST